VTYSVDADPVWQGACYCTNCQRQTATAFSVIVGVPSKDLGVEGDTLASFKTASEGYQSTTERRFCSACGSPIFSTIESMPGVAFVLLCFRGFSVLEHRRQALEVARGGLTLVAICRFEQ
jgi:hypothetical protein